MNKCCLQLVLALAAAPTALGFVATRPSVPSTVLLRAQGDEAFPATAADVFVGNLRYGTDEDLLVALCRSVRGPDGGYLDAEVLKVTVARDEETGKDKGYAFIKVLNAQQAADLADGLDGEEFDGRVLNSNVKTKKGKKKWIDKALVDPATLDDGGLFESLDTLPDRFAIQEFDLTQIRNACKKAGIKAGGDLEQCTDRLMKIKGVSPSEYLEPDFGVISTRGAKRNSGYR